VVFPLNGYGATFTNVVAGGYHNLAINVDGTVVAWGANFFGQSTVPSGLTGVMSNII
jgi:alpha-tubulin suppressor-like RCC1 family protein